MKFINFHEAMYNKLSSEREARLVTQYVAHGFLDCVIEQNGTM